MEMTWYLGIYRDWGFLNIGSLPFPEIPVIVIRVAIFGVC